MNILINCSNLRVGGGLQVAHSFIHELRQIKGHSFIIVLSDALRDYLGPLHFPQHLIFVDYTLRPSIVSLLFGRDIILDTFVNQYHVHRVFTLFGPSYWFPKVQHVIGYAKGHYVYTNSPFFRTLSLWERVKLNLKKFAHLYSFGKSADILIAESWDVSYRLGYIFPKKSVFTVTNTFNPVFLSLNMQAERKLPRFSGFTFLTISANYPHKNLSIIPKVVKYLKRSYPLFKFRFVVTVDYEEIVVEDTNVLDAILFIGKVSISECPSLYRQSDFMFLPTLLECFTATYPEAMCMDTPILTSDLPFARSICGSAAEYFNPLSPKDIGDKIFNLSHDTVKVEELIKMGRKQLLLFDNSKQRADKYLKIITS